MFLMELSFSADTNPFQLDTTREVTSPLLRKPVVPAGLLTSVGATFVSATSFSASTFSSTLSLLSVVVDSTVGTEEGG